VGSFGVYGGDLAALTDNKLRLCHRVGVLASIRTNNNRCRATMRLQTTCTGG
jgi:hypothetical protein